MTQIMYRPSMLHIGMPGHYSFNLAVSDMTTHHYGLVDCVLASLQAKDANERCCEGPPTEEQCQHRSLAFQVHLIVVLICFVTRV